MEVVEVAVSALVKILVQMLKEEIGLLRGFEAALERLATKLESIQSDLQVFEMEQSQRTDIQKWLIDLKGAAYDVQDILADASILNSQRGNKSCLCLPTTLLPRYNLAHKMQNMLKILEDLHSKKSQLPGVNGAGTPYRYGVTPGSRYTISLPSVDESEFVGRDGEMGMIIEKLLDPELDQHDLSVYGMWGIGGLGKTTLAQHIFQRVQKHFGFTIWICVSEGVSKDFSIHRLVKEIADSIFDGEERGKLPEGLDPLQRKLREKLTTKKFLLVLDDVWNDYEGWWNSLRAILRCESKGSLVLVTTRDEKIASTMATIPTHHIAFLTEEDSWSLFQKRASSTGKLDEKLVSIGKKIVDKCGGVPLAIKTLGSLMRSKTEESEWIAVEKSEFWRLKDVENDILNVLKLSYYNLKPHMRQCFAYCCIFPKDYEMEEDQIIQLWMANDLIPSDEGDLVDLVDTGRLIFKELVWRSFFQDIQKNRRGRTTCKMHDLMHDLATSIMRHETCSSIVKSGMKLEIPKSFHHLSCRVEGPMSHKIESPSHDSLRTILLNSDWHYNELLELFSSLLSKQQYLRALHVSRNNMEELPSFICKFEHLKYLVMSCHGMRSLPKSFTCLLNLQTLILMDSGDLVELPNDLNVMKDLRFLEVEGNGSLRCTPPGLGDLTCLRRLSIFIVGEDPPLYIDQLKGLNLEGELTIKGLDNVRNLEDAKNSNLGKRKLTCLMLYWTDSDKNESPQHYEVVLEGLQPHHDNLQELLIYGYHGFKFPNWTGSSTFARLNKIHLEECERCEELPPLGSLPSLKRLSLDSINSVRHIGKEWLGDGGCSFPLLTSLDIVEMSKLEEWSIPDSLECFPKLTSLGISGCPKLNQMPFLPTLKELIIRDSNATCLTSIKNLTSLEECYLSCSNEVDVLPDDMFQNFKALETLRITAGGVRSVSNMLYNLSSLKELDFLGCSKLEGFPEGGYRLHSLERLYFRECESFATFPAIILEGLPSLRELIFWDCKELMEPLSGCLTQVSPLKQLEVKGLSKLQHLPESFKKLTSLTELELNGCPELKKRCKKAEGEDWEKISHIPFIKINGKIIQWIDYSDGEGDE